MAITIKEIQVKAVVQSDFSAQFTDELVLLKFKKELLKEVKEMLRKEQQYKKER